MRYSLLIVMSDYIAPKSHIKNMAYCCCRNNFAHSYFTFREQENFFILQNLNK